MRTISRVLFRQLNLANSEEETRLIALELKESIYTWFLLAGNAKDASVLEKSIPLWCKGSVTMFGFVDGAIGGQPA